MTAKNTITNTDQKIKNLAKKYFDEGVDLRTHLHENPELSSQEFETSKYLKNICRKLGLRVEEVEGSTGFTALLDTGRPGKTLGIRTDIDALPIDEDLENLKKQKTVISKKKNIMHACGHDVHMSVAVTTAKILTDLKDDLNGKIYFIFEEAEETGGGIDAMVRHLKDKELDGVYGNHVDNKLDTGKFAIKRGPVYAGCGGIDIDIIGRGGHGSRPDLAVSPLNAAVNVVNALNTAWNNQVNQDDKVTLGIGAINGGFAANVIPDICNIKGTIRFFDEQIGKEALESLKNITEATAKVHGCQVRFNDYTSIVAKPTTNDIKLADFARKVCEEIFESSLEDQELSFVSESFSGYDVLAPSVFVKLGVRNEDLGSGAGVHTPKFDVDTKVIYYGSGLQSKFAVEFLS